MIPAIVAGTAVDPQTFLLQASLEKEIRILWSKFQMGWKYMKVSDLRGSGVGCNGRGVLLPRSPSQDQSTHFPSTQKSWP